MNEDAWDSLVRARHRTFMKGMVYLTKTLFVGNLPWNVTDEDLGKKFGQIGEVVNARVITDRSTGKSRGFGFVEVSDHLAETFIHSMNMTVWNGREIRVSEAQPREARPANERRFSRKKY